MTFRGFLMWVHLILGLTGAVIIAVLGITGAYITFQEPLQRWLNPVPSVPAFNGSPDVMAIVTAAETRFAPRRVASVAIRPAGEAAVVRLRDHTVVFMNPADATIIDSRQRFASLENLTAVMRGLHTSLLLGPRGRLLITIPTAEALLLALTGLWLWWQKKYWRFRPWRGSVFRVSWDLHNATGIWFFVPVLSMVITGLLLAMPAPIHRLANAAPAPWPGPPGSRRDATLAGEPVALSRVLSVADSAVPGEPMRRLVVPASATGAFAVAKPGVTVFVDQFSGALIEVRPDRKPTAADEATDTVERLHTGELLGVPGRALMTLGSIMLTVMTITGVVLGWKRLVILVGKRAAHRRSRLVDRVTGDADVR